MDLRSDNEQQECQAPPSWLFELVRTR